MSDHLRTLAETARTRIACVPNAGLPDEEGRYHEGPDQFRQVFGRFLDAGWLNLVGGCCGTTGDHVARARAIWSAAVRRAGHPSTRARWSPASRRSSSPSTTARCWWGRRPTSSAAASSAT